MGRKYDKPCKGGEDCYEEGHLCKIVKRTNFDRLRELIKDARYYCGKCGRSAHEAENLCRPVEL
jgi:hypothetical protein